MTQTVLLGDIAYVTKLAGYEFTKYITYDDSGEIIALRALNLKDGRLDLSDIRRISRETSEKLPRSKLTTGDILLSYTGTVGNFAMVEENDMFHLAPNVCLIRANEHCLPDYLYYIIASPGFKQQLLGSAHGSTQATVPMKNIRNLKVILPAIDEQKSIVARLKPIDVKIELNRQMNETLEQMGQALFRHYFIDNPEAENWTKRELGEFFPIKTGKKDANFGTKDGEYPFFTCAQTISKAPDFSFDAHALLLAGNGDFNLKLYRGKFEAYQRTYVLVPNDERLVGLLYFLMKIKLPEITGGSRGSVIRFITKGMIENYKFTLPDNKELVEMAEFFNQLTIHIEENDKQIQTLTTLRDTLLPRLINGKVKL